MGICSGVKTILNQLGQGHLRETQEELNALVKRVDERLRPLNFHERYVIASLIGRVSRTVLPQVSATFKSAIEFLLPYTERKEMRRAFSEMDAKVLFNMEIFAQNPLLSKLIFSRFIKTNPYTVLNHLFELRSGADRFDILLQVLQIHPLVVVERLNSLPSVGFLYQNQFEIALARTLEEINLEWRGEYELEKMPLVRLALNLKKWMVKRKPPRNLDKFLMLFKLYRKSLNFAGSLIVREALQALADRIPPTSMLGAGLFDYAGPFLTDHAILNGIDPNDTHAFEGIDKVNVGETLLSQFLLTMAPYEPEKTLKKAEDLVDEVNALAVFEAVLEHYPLVAYECDTWDFVDPELQETYKDALDKISEWTFDQLQLEIRHHFRKVLMHIDELTALSDDQCLILARKALAETPLLLAEYGHKFGSFSTPENGRIFRGLYVDALERQVQKEESALNFYNFPFTMMKFTFQDLPAVVKLLKLLTSLPMSDQLWFLSNLECPDALKRVVLREVFALPAFASDLRVSPDDLIESGYEDDYRLHQGVCYGLSLQLILNPPRDVTHLRISKEARFYQSWTLLQNTKLCRNLIEVLVSLLNYRKEKETDIRQKRSYEIEAEHWLRQQESIESLPLLERAQEERKLYRKVKLHLQELADVTLVDETGRHIISSGEVARAPIPLLRKLGIDYTYRGKRHPIKGIQGVDQLQTVLDPIGSNFDGCTLLLYEKSSLEHAIYFNPHILTIVDQNATNERNEPLVNRFTSYDSFLEGLFYLIAIRALDYDHFSVEAFKAASS